METFLLLLALKVRTAHATEWLIALSCALRRAGQAGSATQKHKVVSNFVHAGQQMIVRPPCDDLRVYPMAFCRCGTLTGSP